MSYTLPPCLLAALPALLAASCSSAEAFALPFFGTGCSGLAVMTGCRCLSKSAVMELSSVAGTVWPAVLSSFADAESESLLSSSDASGRLVVLASALFAPRFPAYE